MLPQDGRICDRDGSLFRLTLEVYNVGARQELPNLDIAHRILEALDRDASLIRFVEDRPGHDRRYAIDPAKMETQLDWADR